MQQSCAKAPEFGLHRILGWFAGFLLLRLETPVLLAALCKSSRILQSRILGEFAGSRLGTWHAVSGFGSGLLVSGGFLGAKAGFGGFGLWLLVSSGFFDAKAGFGGFGLRV